MFLFILMQLLSCSSIHCYFLVKVCHALFAQIFKWLSYEDDTLKRPCFFFFFNEVTDCGRALYDCNER